MTKSMLDVARAYVAAGLSVLPITKFAKLPSSAALGSPDAIEHWTPQDAPARQFTKRQPTDDELRAWFTGTDHQIGIVGGNVSGGLVVLDFERADLYSLWRTLVIEQEVGLIPLLERLPVVQTGRGHHVYLRMDNPPGNELLCQVGMNGRAVLTETRGEGCYVVAPPSAHPLGGTYHLIQGNPFEIPYLDGATATILIDAARFPQLQTTILDESRRDSRVELYTYGLRISEPLANDERRFVTLDFAEVRALSAWLRRYGLLLAHAEHAVAPNVPDDYDYTYYLGGDDEWEDDDDEAWED